MTSEYWTPLWEYSFNLTTTPERIEERECLSKAIDALNNQTIPPSKIRIAIPEYYARWKQTYKDIPEWLLKKDNVDIIRCKDYGPATKWMCATNANTKYVIVCDDDREMSNKTAEYFFNELKKYPKLQSLSYYGFNWWIKGKINEEIDRNLLICQGTNGWIARTDILKDFPIFWFNAVDTYNECFLVDDVVVSIYMKYKKINYSYIDYPSNDGIGSGLSLSTSNSDYALISVPLEHQKPEIDVVNPSTVYRCDLITNTKDVLMEIINRNDLDTLPDKIYNPKDYFFPPNDKSFK